jgi:hypothetical protein
MRALSFDIGIKTLSFAVLDTSARDPMIDWKIFNMCGNDVIECAHADCKGAVKYVHNQTMYCKRHAKQVPGAIMPGVRRSPTELSRMGVSEVLAVASGLGCALTTRTKKAAIAAIRAHYDQHTLVNYQAPKAADMNMITIAGIIHRDLDARLPCALDGYTALIENQLGPTAVRMRCIQSMLTMHLLHRGCTDIQYISPRRKLEHLSDDVDVSSYAARKKAAREAVPTALDELNCDKRWLEYFNAHKKQDDLADAFLQARWWLRED